MFSLFTPAAAFFLAAGITAGERKLVLLFVCGIGMASAVLGLLQASSGGDSLLYFYGNPNDGSAQGFFANRNHQALFLALCIPLSFLWADDTSASSNMNIGRFRIKRDFFLAWIYVLFLAFMIVVIGSRAGLLLGIVAAFGAVAIFSQGGRSSEVSNLHGPSKRAGLIRAYFFALLIGLTVALIALYFGRAEAITRLLATEQSNEERIQILPSVVAMTKEFMPFGTGLGTFETMFKVIEPDNLLSYTVMNRAHNDWLELLLTGGTLSLLIIFWFQLIIFRNIWRLLRKIYSDGKSAKLGFVSLLIMILFGLASLGDYPLRMPSLQCIFILVFMAFLDAANDSKKDSLKSIYNLEK